MGLDPLVAFLTAGDAEGDGFRLKGFSLQEDLTCSCGDELPGEGAGLWSPANRKGVGVAPLQGLVAWVPGLPLVLACGTCSPPGCPSSPEDDREELAEGAAEFPDVPGTPGTCTVGSEELLGTTGGSEGSALAAGLELSEDRLSTLRAGDGVAEGGSEWDRRAAWRTSGEALGALGAGRFFVLGLLVEVMPYQGCRDLGVDSGGAGAGLGPSGAGSSPSSSSSKGL